jgi:hypothetical protein
MAQDPFDLLISRMLDHDLTPEEQASVEEHIAQNPHAQTTVERFQHVDAMLHNQRELPLPFDLTAGVMARIEAYEVRKMWTPWIIALVVLFGLMTLTMFIMPWLLVSGILTGLVADVPIIGTVIIGLAQIMEYAVLGATFFVNAVSVWLHTLTTDPLILGLVVSALVVSSIYIGLREGQRVYTLALMEAQASGS